VNQWTRAGIHAVRAGDPDQARRFFKLAEMEAPNELAAWFWSVELAESDAERQRYLERILTIDPGQSAAQTALDAVNERLRRAELPHVSPFVMEETEAGAPVPSRPFVTPVEVTAPVVIQREPVLQSRLPGWLRQPWWVWASLACAALAVYAIVSWLITLLN
jgi:hypothetical protein